jgi:HK97 family phage portal protein
MKWPRFGPRADPVSREVALRGALDAQVKASMAGPIISAWNVGRPAWTPRDYAALALEGFQKNAIAYRCIKLIASSAAAAPWILSSGDTEIEEHPLLTLLARPNPMASGAALMEAFFAYELLQGNTYLEAVGPDNRPPRELWNHRPDRMQVIPGPQGIPQGFEYTANGQRVRWQVDPLTGLGPILHLKEFHPLDDWYGLGRTEPAAYAIDRHNAASAHNKALLDNGARPSGALVFKPIKGQDGQVTPAPDTVVAAALKELRATGVGPQAAGQAHVYGGDVEWLEMGITPRDMDFGEGKADAARDICLAYGVPHILIVPGASTYNNVREAKLELWEDTILPLLDRTLDALNGWLCPMFGDGLTLGVDLDEISALEPRRETKRKTVIDLLDKGVIDADEARDALQYEPRAAEAVKKVDAAVLRALVEAAKAGTAQLEPLFRYQKSVGLLPPETTLEAFMNEFEAEEVDETDPEALAAVTPRDPTAPPTANDPNAAEDAA